MHLADKTAECGHCGRRIVLYLFEETLRYHKLPDKSAKCPGTCTWDYTQVRSGKPTPISLPEVVEDLSPQPFRTLPYENWLNRWERKFGVKIPDENVKKLTNGKFVRRSPK